MPSDHAMLVGALVEAWNDGAVLGKVVPQVHRDAVVEIGRGDGVEIVPVVVARVVDQDIDGADALEAGVDGLGVAQIAVMVDRSGAVGLQAAREGAAGVVLDIGQPGAVVHAHPMDALASGAHRDVDVLLSMASDDMGWWAVNDLDRFSQGCG